MTSTFQARLIRQNLAAGYDPVQGSRIIAERLAEQKAAA